jgi:hypothetical protein
MPLITTAIPNLVQGVSQQPSSTRFDGQCEEQLNALSSVTDGLKKRPPMQFMGKLFDDTSGLSDKDSFAKALIKFIERDANERYLITLRDGLLRIFRIESEEDTVVECSITIDSTGQSYSSGYQFSQSEYLYSETSDQNIKTLTIGDSTFLVNTARNVGINNSLVTANYLSKAVVFVKQSDYEKEYKVSIPIGAVSNVAVCKTGTSVGSGTGANAYDTGAGSVATSSGRIVDVLVSKINAFTGVSCTKIDDAHFEISGDLAGNLDHISVSDDLFGNGLGLVYKEVDNISKLPVVCINGLIVKIVGDVEENQDDYYVRFETSNAAASGKGAWVETVAPNIRYRIDVNTPMQLVNTSPNTFVLYSMPLSDRVVGDNNSNPFPSFVGAPISNLFLFKSRLGFLSKDAVILSESGFGGTEETVSVPTTRQKFNFFRTTVTALLDAEPIDVRVSNRDVTTLRAAQPFQEDLMIFSDSAQFKLSGGDLLTPQTVSINQVTSFDYNKSVEPLPLGSYLYFPFDRGIYSGIREYTVNSNTSTFDSEEITQHVPQYIPKDLTSFTGSDAENIIALSSGDITYTDTEPYFNGGDGTGFKAFDFAIVRYIWTSAGGTDLDTRTQVIEPYVGYSVGWSRYPEATGLEWGGDNTEIGAEAVLIDFQEIANNNNKPSSSIIQVALSAFWYNICNSGDFTLEFETYLGGTMVSQGYDFVNNGGVLVDSFTVGKNTQIQQSADIDGERVATILYNPITRTAVLSS